MESDTLATNPQRPSANPPTARPSASSSISQNGYDSFGRMNTRATATEAAVAAQGYESDNESEGTTDNTHLKNRAPQQVKSGEKKAQQVIGQLGKGKLDTSPIFEPRSMWEKLQWFMLFPPLLGENTEQDAEADKLQISHPWSQLALKVRATEKVIDSTGSALASGLSVSAIIYAFGPMSGAHVNPAVSFLFFLRRAFPGRWLVAYWLHQFIGGLLAAAMLRSLFDTRTEAQQGSSYPDGGYETETVFWAETLCSSIFFVFILSVSKKGGLQGANAGLAVGMTLFWILLLRTEIGSGSLNPFRSLCVAIVNGPIDVVWPYIAGPFCGTFVAATFVWLQFGNVSEEELQKAQGLGEE